MKNEKIEFSKDIIVGKGTELSKLIMTVAQAQWDICVKHYEGNDG